MADKVDMSDRYALLLAAVGCFIFALDLFRRMFFPYPEDVEEQKTWKWWRGR